MTRDLDALKRRSREGEKNLVKMLAAIDSLEKERDQLRLRVADLSAINGDLSATNGDLAATNGEGENRLRQREAQLQELLKEVEEKGEELNDVWADNERKRKIIDDLKAEVAGSRAETEEGRAELESMKAEMTAM